MCVCEKIVWHTSLWKDYAHDYGVGRTGEITGHLADANPKWQCHVHRSGRRTSHVDLSSRAATTDTNTYPSLLISEKWVYSPDIQAEYIREIADTWSSSVRARQLVCLLPTTDLCTRKYKHCRCCAIYAQNVITCCWRVCTCAVFKINSVFTQYLIFLK